MWAAVNLISEGASFAVLITDKARVGDQAATALAELFGALVLSMYSTNEAGSRLHWLASGFVVLGLGHLAFGYVEPNLTGSPTSLNQALYEGMFVRTIAGAFFVVGLIPKTPPQFPWRLVAFILSILAVAYVFVFEATEEMDPLPPLTHVETPEAAAELGDAFLGWLTWWHWVFYAVPLALAVASLIGAIRQSRRGTLRLWLLFAMVLFAGAQLHDYLWPTTYGSPALTTADLLGFAFAAMVVGGGVIELRRIAAQRATLLTVEKENTRRLSELAALRADFTSMVVHELGAPLSAARRLSEVLRIDDLDPETRSWTADAQEKELDILSALVKDVQAAAAAEHDDFKVKIHPVSLSVLLSNAETFSRTLSGNHHVNVVLDPALKPQEEVMADPERIGQVLRNLLSNAAKYSPEDAPIELRVQRGPGRVQIEVADQGTGIHPEDITRIFEKFGRGRDQGGRKVPGVGLGLYLSRRIAQAHGSELTVDSKLGEGSVFGFELEIAP